MFYIYLIEFIIDILVADVLSSLYKDFVSLYGKNVENYFIKETCS